MSKLIPLLALLVACDSPPAEVVGAPKSQTPTTPVVPTPGPDRYLYVRADTSDRFVGDGLLLTVEAQDLRRNNISTSQALVTSSNTSVASLLKSTVIPIVSVETGQRWEELYSVFRLVGPGTATLHVTLQGVSDSVVVNVRNKPSRENPSLVVDSFTVVEYPVHCAWACPYLSYAPLLTLREPSGRNTVDVISVEFTLGDRTTGVCRGRVTYPPGRSAHLNGIDEYLWSNDLIFVSLDGQPLRADVATARVIARDAGGRYSEIVATSAIQRMVMNPALPAPTGSGWECY